MLETFLTDDYKIKDRLPNTDYIPDNEASIIRSLKSLYDLNPRLILYKVCNIKANYNLLSNGILFLINKTTYLFQIGMAESISL